MELKKIVEQFGEIKYINLIEDPLFPGQNKGFCFFEYVFPGVIEKAISALSKLTFGENKLKVHKANIEKNTSIAKQIKDDHEEFIKKNKIDTEKARDFSYLKDDKFKEKNVFENKNTQKFSDSHNINDTNNGNNDNLSRIINYELPQSHCYNPSRVIMLLNAICAEDVMDDLEYREILDDMRLEASKYGSLLHIEIPRPCKIKGICGPAVGKVFIKYLNLVSAKVARFKISGLKYNNRTVVASFYPENLYDIRDFIINDKPVVINK